MIEVFRINIGDDSGKETTARTAWEALANSLTRTDVLSGVSVNLPERLFLGMIGWSGIEVSSLEDHRILSDRHSNEKWL